MTPKTKDYEILRKVRDYPTWLTLRIDNKWYIQGQVFAVPSIYGIGARDNDGNYLPGVDDDHLPASARISRLCITDNPGHWGHGHAIYNYDRGLDFDETPPGLLDRAISAVLEAAR